MLLAATFLLWNKPLEVKALQTQFSEIEAPIIIGGNTLLALQSHQKRPNSVLASFGGVDGIPEQERVKLLIRAKYPDLSDLMIKLSFCEASNRHEGIWGDKGRAYGTFQFWQGTFNHYCSGLRYDLEDQTDCVYDMIKMGIGRQHWTNCWVWERLDRFTK